MTINVTEVIRKTVGWCPNISALESKKVLITLPEDKEIQGEKIGINPAEMGRANKYRNYVLLMTLTGIAGFGLTALLIKYLLGVSFNQFIILKGTLIGIILAMLAVFYEWRQLNRIDNLRIGLMRSVFLQTSLQLAVFFAVITLLIFTIGKDDPLQFMLSIFFPLQWIHYPLVINWERKNKKTIYLVEEKLLRWRPVALPGNGNETPAGKGIVYEENAPYSNTIKAIITLIFAVLAFSYFFAVFGHLVGSRKVPEQGQFAILLAASIYALVMWGFFSMKFRITHTGVEAMMPPFKYTIPFSEIKEVRTVKNIPWYVGWGVRLWGKRLAFVSMRKSAVEIEKKSGFFRRLVLTTQNPEEFVKMVMGKLE